MQKECLYCGKIFESTAKSIYKQKARKFCSAQCASDYRMSQPEFVEKISKIQREVQNRSDVKQKNAAGVRRKWEEKEFRENTIKSQTIAQNRPDVLEKTKLRTKKIANRPENIERMRARMTDNMKNVLYREKIKQGVAVWEERGGREEHSKKMISKWKDENFAERMFKSTVKYKEYKMPSGRIVKLQGYEPIILTKLLEQYNEDDIVCESKFISECIGKILYEYKGKTRRYYPDFYIKSTNTIIEVKSTYTFELHKEKNLAKEQACAQQGFNFEFKIYK